MNKLRQYRKERKIKQREFAALVGASNAYICAIEKGHRLPGRDLAIRIARATDGAVPVESWYKDDAA